MRFSCIHVCHRSVFVIYFAVSFALYIALASYQKGIYPHTHSYVCVYYTYVTYTDAFLSVRMVLANCFICKPHCWIISLYHSLLTGSDLQRVYVSKICGSAVPQEYITLRGFYIHG